MIYEWSKLGANEPEAAASESEQLSAKGRLIPQSVLHSVLAFITHATT